MELCIVPRRVIRTKLDDRTKTIPRSCIGVEGEPAQDFDIDGAHPRRCGDFDLSRRIGRRKDTQQTTTSGVVIVDGRGVDKDWQLQNTRVEAKVNVAVTMLHWPALGDAVHWRQAEALVALVVKRESGDGVVAIEVEGCTSDGVDYIEAHAMPPASNCIARKSLLIEDSDCAV